MKLCCFVVTVFFGTDAKLQVTAGTSAGQAQAPNRWFTLNPRADDPAAIIGEILAKLKVALENGGDGIDVTTNGRIILKTPRDFPGVATAKSADDQDTTKSISKHAKEALINPNTATEEELRSLPGVGPVIAARIVAGRPYRSIEDLMKVDGIGADKLADLRPRARVK
jgi:DNA uptake protein ComE-like DNA-binding protein